MSGGQNVGADEILAGAWAYPLNDRSCRVEAEGLPPSMTMTDTQAEFDNGSCQNVCGFPDFGIFGIVPAKMNRRGNWGIGYERTTADLDPSHIDQLP
ncbi:hypothetical protein CCP4SC76_1700009 [Gammaproteobacteria bacterium]